MKSTTVIYRGRKDCSHNIQWIMMITHHWHCFHCHCDWSELTIYQEGGGRASRWQALERVQRPHIHNHITHLSETMTIFQRFYLFFPYWTKLAFKAFHSPDMNVQYFQHHQIDAHSNSICGKHQLYVCRAVKSNKVMFGVSAPIPIWITWDLKWVYTVRQSRDWM